MMHATCIAAFRNRNRGSHRRPADSRSGLSLLPRPTAVAEQQTHQCVLRQANATAYPAFYTICGILVPSGNVAQSREPITCTRCLQNCDELLVSRA
jgi:hypothetical protein